jgi:hypothetical protein
MENKTKIFGSQTKYDWINLRTKLLITSNDKDLWKQTALVLHNRLNTRYFRPIERILSMRISSGEGFAVMTLICSLIEFLQSSYEGKTYSHSSKKDDKIYGKSEKKFKDFFETHEPFKSIFKKSVSTPNSKFKTYSDDFYSNVRCGLLHEAATMNGWTIIVSNKSKKTEQIVDLTDESNKIIFKGKFYEGIKSFYKNYEQLIIDYEKDANNKFLRDNLCRKLDSLCFINDTSAKWWNVQFKIDFQNFNESDRKN